jgi:hypothetical protein
VIERYARRWGIENHLAEQIRAFHLDSLAAQVPLSVDFDTTLTVLADACYRRLSRQLRGHAHATPETLRGADSRGALVGRTHPQLRLPRLNRPAGIETWPNWCTENRG